MVLNLLSITLSYSRIQVIHILSSISARLVFSCVILSPQNTKTATILFHFSRRDVRSPRPPPPPTSQPATSCRSGSLLLLLLLLLLQLSLSLACSSVLEGKKRISVGAVSHLVVAGAARRRPRGGREGKGRQDHRKGAAAAAGRMGVRGRVMEAVCVKAKARCPSHCHAAWSFPPSPFNRQDVYVTSHLYGKYEYSLTLPQQCTAAPQLHITLTTTTALSPRTSAFSLQYLQLLFFYTEGSKPRSIVW
ncbi:hypothetical protein E2C01_023308 [Portunus trituberculatus]|uniref:Uncharacterized protein n=1 Tax=Portunus trituberculatus TaxID=210409 RepID=A0A5B7EB91_PORTR|nr:hypothetical protein [Portunus trituberculatus]